MATLANARHEKFSQLIAGGTRPTIAYKSLGYSAKGASQSAHNLLKRTDVRRRVDEIQGGAAASIAAEVAFDQQRVLNRLDVLSRKAEELGQISVAVRCEELIGKHRGMFVDRQAAEGNSNGLRILDVVREARAERLARPIEKDDDPKYTDNQSNQPEVVDGEANCASKDEDSDQDSESSSEEWQHD